MDEEAMGNQAKDKEIAAQANDMFRWATKLVGAGRNAVEFSAEEKAEHSAIATEYNRQTSLEDMRYSRDLATKVWLQQRAIAAIPSEALKAAALELDNEPPPQTRPFPFFDTPPIDGFNVRKYDGTLDQKEFGDDDHDDGVGGIDLSKVGR
jgi:hypothetical protein